MNCPKQVEFYSKNKYDKLVHLVGFIIRAFRIISLFLTKCCLFHYFIFVCSNNTFSINHMLKLKYPTRKGKGYPKNRKDWLVKCRKYKTCFILLYYFISKHFSGSMYIQTVTQEIRHARCVVRASGSRHFEGTPCLHLQESGGTSLLERPEPHTERASVASNSAVRTSYFESLCFIHTGLWFT